MREGFWRALVLARAAYKADKHHLENAPLSKRKKKEAENRLYNSEQALNRLKAEQRAERKAIKEENFHTNMRAAIGAQFKCRR
jgi:hypothetical protein